MADYYKALIPCTCSGRRASSAFLFSAQTVPTAPPLLLFPADSIPTQRSHIVPAPLEPPGTAFPTAFICPPGLPLFCMAAACLPRRRDCSCNGPHLCLLRRWVLAPSDPRDSLAADQRITAWSTQCARLIAQHVAITVQHSVLQLPMVSWARRSPGAPDVPPWAASPRANGEPPPDLGWRAPLSACGEGPGVRSFPQSRLVVWD